jgi:hypothetical protein
MSEEQKPKLWVQIAARSMVVAMFLAPVAIVCAIAFVVIHFIVKYW